MGITQTASRWDDVPAWPTPEQSPAPKGHNKPPLEELIPVEFREALLSDRPDFLVRLGELVAAAERAKATNDEELGRCGNLVNGYRALLKHITETHKTVKEPYLLGGRLVDAEKNALVEQVEAAKRKVEGIGNAYEAEKQARERAERLRIEAEQRAAAEEAARAEREAREAELAAERAAAQATNDEERQAAAEAAARAQEEAQAKMEAAALAAAAPTKAEPIRSDEGAVVSGKQEWKCSVEDYTVAFIEVSDHPKVREAIDKAVAQLVKAGKREIAGCRVWPVAKANFR